MVICVSLEKRDRPRRALIDWCLSEASMGPVWDSLSGQHQIRQQAFDRCVDRLVDCRFVEVNEANGLLRDLTGVQKLAKQLEVDASQFGKIFESFDESNVEDEAHGELHPVIMLDSSRHVVNWAPKRVVINSYFAAHAGQLPATIKGYRL